MRTLELFKQFRIPISWEILRSGWLGPGNFSRQLQSTEITGFAESQLATASHSTIAAVSELCAPTNEDAITAALCELAPELSEDTALAWKLCLLKKAIDGLPQEPLYGLTELTDFWAQWEYPEDSPHTVQGRGNNIQPSEYYTEENYQGLVSAHRDWLEEQVNALLARTPGSQEEAR